ncbi:MAG: HlyD family efflux transporter periplasmic adaptor subunit [Nitratireductor sp.]|nr:HlyD family efflux transporter periplasmic adaptor subunit [Nitratireductor sp.]MCC0019579.1 HlyD family efflux transporter periplasmic adaptor subunit [Nitratireductor sp.]
MAGRTSRTILTLVAAAAVGGALAYAFWPRPVQVDMQQVERGPMMVTIDEEARTTVHDIYVVSTPINGRLQRVEVLPGTAVIKDKTVVARMLPSNPDILDVRTREQAETAVRAAEAVLQVARADADRAEAELELARSNLERISALRANNTASQAALDDATQKAKSAQAAAESAKALIAVREAELANARARMIGFDDTGLANALQNSANNIVPIHAPESGVVLRINQQSETTLPVGSKIMEIGNVDNDLEIQAELLSSDALKIREGNRVIITDWGGEGTLEGVVSRIDPWGYTKTSALGVEEQRVNVTISFAGNRSDREGLGHGFRVDVRIVIWEDDNALIVPASALFRKGTHWYAFKVIPTSGPLLESGTASARSGTATLTKVDIGRNNGITAEVIDGLAQGDQVIVFPSQTIADGTRVVERIVE